MPLAERQLIARIRKRAGAGKPGRVVLGIGDDSAVVRLGANDALITTDLSVEGIHFRRDFHSADSIGHRALARGLSDIAAMGGEPVAAFLSLAVPAETPQSWVDQFMGGFLRLAEHTRTALAGGDTSSGPAIMADVTIVGQIAPGRELRRSGASDGDVIYVTGFLGRSAAVLYRLREGSAVPSPKSVAGRPHFYPEPRLAVGQYLSTRGLATAAIDVSDGLSIDLGHICQMSRVGAVVAEHSIPRPVLPSGPSTLHLALHGGEDYELLFTASPKTKIPARIGKVPVRAIGRVIADRSCRVYLADSHGQRKEIAPRGWQHFAS